MHETYELTLHISNLIQEQESISWRRFFEGWIHHSWYLLHGSHYKFLKSRRPGKRWVVALIKKQWEISWDLWEHRNGILHEKENVVSLAEARKIDKNIREVYLDFIHCNLSNRDKHLVHLSLSQRLSKDSTYKKIWLQ